MSRHTDSTQSYGVGVRPLCICRSCCRARRAGDLCMTIAGVVTSSAAPPNCSRLGRAVLCRCSSQPRHMWRPCETTPQNGGQGLPTGPIVRVGPPPSNSGLCRSFVVARVWGVGGCMVRRLCECPETPSDACVCVRIVLRGLGRGVPYVISTRLAAPCWRRARDKSHSVCANTAAQL